jgi:hypothetical protein
VISCAFLRLPLPPIKLPCSKIQGSDDVVASTIMAMDADKPRPQTELYMQFSVVLQVALGQCCNITILINP